MGKSWDGQSGTRFPGSSLTNAVFSEFRDGQAKGFPRQAKHMLSVRIPLGALSPL